MRLFLLPTSVISVFPWYKAAALCPLKARPLSQLRWTWANFDYMPTHVTNYECDEGIPCHDHTGEYRWADSWDIWAAEIWTPPVRVCQIQKGGQPTQWRLTLGALGPADHVTWTEIVVVRAACRHVLCSKGESVVVMLIFGVCCDYTSCEHRKKFQMLQLEKSLI